MAQFNKHANLKFEGNDSIYRIPSEHLSSDKPDEIERSIKRKVVSHPLEHQLLVPKEVTNEGRYTIITHDLNQLYAFDRLEELTLREKLPYYYSLVRFGEEEKKGNLKIVWDKANFTVDLHEQNLKVLFYETECSKVFTDPDINIVTQVKHLMLLSLTSLTRIIGLPKRINLLEQDQLNIEFCESLYRLDSLDDIFYLIEKTEDTFTRLETEEEEEGLEVTKKKKGFFKGKAKKEKKPKIKTKKAPKEKVQPTYNHPSQKKKVTRFDKKTLILLASVAVMGLIYLGGNLLSGSDQKASSEFAVSTSPNKASATYFKSSDNQAVKSSLIRAYRASYARKYKEAYTVLETINLRDLAITDLQMVISVYDSEKQLASLLDENPVPELANEVITYLITKDKLNQLTDISSQMKTANPYIEFETAYLNQKYETVIELKDSVELNGRKEGQIVESYLQLQRVEEATTFAQSVGNPDLIKQIEGFSSY